METCRACGISLLNQNECDDLEKYANIYFQLTSLQLHDHEDLDVLKICLTCVEKLLDFDSFREVCAAVHWKLQCVKSEPHDECREAECRDQDSDNEKNALGFKCEDVKNNQQDVDQLTEAQIPVSLFIPSVELVKDEFLPEDGVEPPKKKKRAKYGSTPKPKKPTQYNCDRCTGIFQDSEMFTAHKRMHDGLKPFVCELCVLDFETLLELNVHNVQNHAQRKVLTCDHPECGEQFSSHQALRHHRMRAHDPNFVPVKSEPKVYICETCGEFFKTKQKLTMHSYSHNPEDKPHVCQLCFMKFARPDKLRLHLMRHEGVRNFLCPFCGVRKTTRGELVSHMKNIHKLEQSALDDVNLECLTVEQQQQPTPDSEVAGTSALANFGPKRCRNESSWKRNVIKQNRNSGKEYISENFVLVKGKTFQQQFDCGCPKKCATMFSSDAVLEEFFKSFWDLSDWHKQNVLLNQHVKSAEISRHRPRVGVRPQRSVVFHYFIPDGQASKRVCQKYFISILQVSAGRVYKSLGRK